MIGKTPVLALASLLVGSFILPLHVLSADDLTADQVVSNWLKTNEGVSRLKLSFTQKQAMKTVKVPIIQRGDLWLDLDSKKFRWDAGQTLVIGDSSKITIQRTGTKKYEVRPAGTGGAPGVGFACRRFPQIDEPVQRAIQTPQGDKRDGRLFDPCSADRGQFKRR